MPKKKNPWIAAILSLILGPLGYLYIGWRYALLGIVILLLFVGVLMVVDFDPAVMPGIRSWIKYPLLFVFAWKAHSICTVRNGLIDAQDEKAKMIGAFPFAAMAMTDLLVGLAMFYAGALGLYASAVMLSEGRIVKGLLTLLVGTPALVWIATMMFGFIAVGVDAVFARGAKNVFRR